MRFSVIIPVYNNPPELIDRAIQSVLSQCYNDYEILLVNDGTTEKKTNEYLEKISKNEKVHQIKLERNSGISSARQQGITHATGDWICFLDCDDYYKNDYLLKFSNAINSNNELDVVMCGFEIVDKEEKILHTFPQDDARQNYIYYGTTAIWNRVYRKSFLEDNNIHFPIGCLTEDMIFVAQVNLYAKQMFFINENLYVNFCNEDSTSRKKSFTELSIEKIPFADIALLIDKTSDMEICIDKAMMIRGMLYEQLIILSCLLTRHIRNTALLCEILRLSVHNIRKIQNLDKVVKKWFKNTNGDRNLRFMEFLLMIATKLRVEYCGMYALNRLIGRIR